MAFGVACALEQRIWGCAHSHGGVIRITLKPETLRTWVLRHTLNVTGKARAPVKITHGSVAVTGEYV